MANVDVLSTSSQALVNLIFTALDHGVASVKASGGPLIPFVMHEGDGQRKLVRMATTRLEEGIDKARDYIRLLPASTQRYALVFDGFLTIAGQRSDAIYVEGGERGQSLAASVAQRYKPKKGLFGKFTVIGNAANLGDVYNLLVG